MRQRGQEEREPPRIRVLIVIATLLVRWSESTLSWPATAVTALRNMNTLLYSNHIMTTFLHLIILLKYISCSSRIGYLRLPCLKWKLSQFTYLEATKLRSDCIFRLGWEKKKSHVTLWSCKCKTFHIIFNIAQVAKGYHNNRYSSIKDYSKST